MEIEVKVPSIGESVTQAVVARILKAENAFVQKDEEIAELETDKANQMVYSPAEGKIHWKVQEQQTVQIGQTLAFIEEGFSVKASQQKHKEENTSEKPVSKPEEKAFVEKAKEGETRKKMSRLRKVVAQRLVEVNQQTAMLTTFNEIDMTKVMALRENLKKDFFEKHQVKLGFVSFFMKAVCEALLQYPELNAFIEREDIVYHDFIDLGVAVSTDRGLMVPVIKGVQRLNFVEIEKTLKGFAEKARTGQILAQDLQGGTFTITNGGSFGSLFSTPILNPPQSAILGMHTIQERPIAVDGKVVIHPMMYVALSYDHRIIDGKEAIGFLKRVKEELENPSAFFTL